MGPTAHGTRDGAVAGCRRTCAGMRRVPMNTSLPILMMVLLFGGCANAPSTVGWVRSEVYFGLHRPDGGAVTAAEWQAFVNDVITPKFPAGLTVVDSVGQWRHATGRIEREPSKVLVLLHPASRQVEAQIDEIRRLYRERFAQEAVMKVTSPANVEF
jgi:hypothetical protein